VGFLSCGIGGLWIKSKCVGEFSVACLFKNIKDHFSWAFAGVYGLNSNGDRRLLRDELAGLISWWNFYWFIGGWGGFQCFSLS
jgi:hypothetical protein